MKHHQHYLTLNPILYHKQHASPLDNPRLVHFNHALYKTLSNLPFDHFDWCGIIGTDNDTFPSEFRPLAMVYAGHQFGQWAGQLGDGRGLLLTQVINHQGKIQDLHLKGAGKTPFSRFGDGRAMIDSTVREYLCGHALSCLGVLSSNALGFVVSDTIIARHQMVCAAALLRVSDCHVRLGHFEWLAVYHPKLLGEFTHQMIDTYYPQLDRHDISGFLKQVCQNTAKLIAQWQLVGFSHGVMNTDNINITGTTLDFGPFGMMERFNPDWINNQSDHLGRYTYQNQPTIGHWNLKKWLACFDLLSIKQSVMALCLDEYEQTFYTEYNTGICQKIGLPLDDDSLALAYEFVSLLKTYQLDYTNSFRALIGVLDNTNDNKHEKTLLHIMTKELNAQENGLQSWQNWVVRYHTKINKSTTIKTAIDAMRQVNPVYILRNDMAQRAIEHTIHHDFNEVARLFKLLTNPFVVQDIAKADDITPIHPYDMMPISCMS
ncbi:MULTISPECIES: protein adenylyltransferase SelO family protein [unclassified Moraxella]|uniref:protein adenylyltransferase SelO family protein n=1 Tax=unclassified Moraxella TaxID=2685852 RepID=UPI002B406CDF|nr:MULTISPECIES: protein adenylyltransferase SelO family protein [unclassified Moraxella]